MAEKQPRIFYKAIVCSEPTAFGGIKIRIPEIHGISQMTQTWMPVDQLPYAYPASQIMSDDYGQKMTPLLGTQVYVAQYDTSNYIYFGSALPSTTYQVHTQVREVFLGEDVILKQPAVLDTMPYQSVVFKSLKGSTIEVSDQDLAEYIRIVGPQGGYIELGNQGIYSDRRGQILSTFRDFPTVDDIGNKKALDTYIHIDDGKGNNIHIDKTGTITINCKKFVVNADESRIQGL